MALKGIFRFFTHRLFEIFVIVVLILLMPNLPPYTNFSEPFRVATKPLEGKLALNEKLNDVEIWHKGNFIGPEAIEEYNGELYVSLYGGDIVKLTGNHITPIVKTGKPCKGSHEERICGRPLGMQFDKNGNLYVADAYYGIFRVNVKTGEKTLVISVNEEINGKKPKLPNSIALASNGDIYWSDSSTQFLLEDGVFDMLADASGRLIHYDAKTRTNRVLVDKLHFANGVVLSEDETFVLVAETVRNRIHRYHLQGPNKGTQDIFIDGLPGLVDNLKPDGKGGFLVPLLIGVDSDHPFAIQVIGPFPLLRKLVGRVLGLTQLFFETINKVYPCEFAERGIHFVGHFTSFSSIFTPRRVTIVRLDKHGQIVDSIHNLNKKITHICEALVFKETLYLGSPFNDYIAKIPLSKIGWEELATPRVKREIPVEKPTTQRPSTTTAKPTTTTTRPPTTTTPPPTTTTTPRPGSTRPPTTTSAPTTTPRPVTTSPPPASKQAPPPNQQTPPKQQPTPNSNQQAPQKQTPPPKQQTPPPRHQTPPPRQQTPPPKQQTPPPKQQTPTPKQDTPPPKQQTPPKEQTAPPKQQTPPPKQQTPTPKQQSPPKQTTPPPVAQPVRDQTNSIPVQQPSTKRNI